MRTLFLVKIVNYDKLIALNFNLFAFFLPTIHTNNTTCVCVYSISSQCHVDDWIECMIPWNRNGKSLSFWGVGGQAIVLNDRKILKYVSDNDDDNDDEEEEDDENDF